MYNIQSLMYLIYLNYFCNKNLRINHFKLRFISLIFTLIYRIIMLFFTILIICNCNHMQNNVMINNIKCL